MKFFNASVIPFLFLTSIDSKKIKTASNYANLTMNEYLRVYVTEPNTEYSRDSREVTNHDRHESGKAQKLLDLDGYLRKKFVYEVTTTDPRVSVICSPFSAMMPLGILLFGAGDKATEREISKATGVEKKSHAHDYFKDLRRKIKQLPEVSTHLASRVFIRDSKHVRSHFKKEAESTFGACIESINMDHPSRVASEVNEWVRRHTNDRITEIIKPSDISPWTVVMVADAIYFAGHWLHRFDHGQPDTFYGANGKHTVNLMKTKKQFTYGTSNVLKAEAIQIPYKGESAYMLVILPHSRDGLEGVLHRLKKSPELINKIKMRETLVELHLPKFKIESSLDLKVLYQKIGMKEILMEGAGFSDVVKDGTVKIDSAIHKVIIEVNELGTIAAASSITQAVGASRPVDLVVFKADHPFLFFIIGRKQQLFAGTFVG